MECLCGGLRAGSSAHQFDWTVRSITGLRFKTRPGHNIDIRHSISADSQHIVITSNPQNTETLIFLSTNRKAFIKNSKLLSWEIFKKGKTYMLFSCGLWGCRVSATPPTSHNLCSVQTFGCYSSSQKWLSVLRVDQYGECNKDVSSLSTPNLHVSAGFQR